MDEIKNYFIRYISEKEIMSKRLNKYIALFVDQNNFSIKLFFQHQVVFFILLY